MTLRRRTLLIISTMFLCLVLILYFMIQGISLSLYEDIPSNLYGQLRPAIAYIILSVVGFGLLFGLATIFLVEKQVISRLTRLSNGIEQIGKGGDLSSRVSMGGKDELSKVAENINGMLIALQQSEDKLHELLKKEKELGKELQDEIINRVEFTRALVHEIKTPLTPLLANSELLAEEVKEETLQRLARGINKGAVSLNQRIDELLDLARGEVGKLTINPASVDIKQLLQEIASEMGSIIQQNGLSLDLELPKSLPKAWVDQDRLRQVVLNLINNAIKFTPSGGNITLWANKKGNNLVIEVQDTGPGISKESQQWLFKPYYQLGGETTRRKGLGLGLSLSKKLIELHGGKIWVDSQKGKGSIFGFSLPYLSK